MPDDNPRSPRDVTTRLLELSERTFTENEHRMHHAVIEELRTRVRRFEELQYAAEDYADSPTGARFKNLLAICREIGETDA